METLVRYRRRSPRPPLSEPVRSRAGICYLVAIIALGTAIRVYGIESYPFEGDEIYSIIESSKLLDSPLQPGIEARPLYYLLQHALLLVLPPTHLGMRVLPLVLGIAGLGVTWALGRLLFGSVGAAVAAFLVAISPWHVHVSGMARYGSLLYLLSAVFLLFLIRASASDRPRDYLITLVALAMGTATHPTFLFPMVGVALAVSLVGRDGRFSWNWPTRQSWIYLWAPFLTALGGALGLLMLLGKEDAVRNFSGRGMPASIRLLPAIVEWMTPVIFVAGAVGSLVAIGLATSPAVRRWGVMAFIGSLATFALLLAASFVTNVYADYAVTMLPLVFVSAGGLIALWSDRTLTSRAVFCAAACTVLLAGVLPALASHFSDGMRFDFRPALRYVSDTAPDVPLLISPIVQQRHYAPDLDGRQLLLNTEFLDDVLAKERSVWIAAPIRREGLVMDTDGSVAAWIDRHCLRVQSHERQRFDYRVYRVDLFRCSEGGPKSFLAEVL